MSETELRNTPYKGLMPYEEEDALFFFGREQVQHVIINNLMGSRLTLLYGPSGVGKSSVLRAGVVHRMREMAQQELALRGKPQMATIIYSSWSADPLAGLLDQIRQSVSEIYGAPPIEVLPDALLSAPLTFADKLKLWTDCIDGKLFLILDQFEEYFLYPQKEGEGSFAEEFTNAVNRSDLRVNFLLSLREDWYAKLDQFKKTIPKLFDNNLRVELLDREAAREAIEKPVNIYNEMRAEGQPLVTIEGGFSERVLEQLARLADKNLLSEAGQGTASQDLAATDPAKTRIQTPYLQLVMTRLWREAFEQNSMHPVLHPRMLDAGEKGTDRAEEIIQSHLNEVMGRFGEREQKMAANIFYHLVTPSGTKVAQKLMDLAAFAKASEAELAPLLSKLSEKESGILTTVAPSPGRLNVPRYEIFHDVLGPAILSWTKDYANKLEIEAATFKAAQEAADREREATQLLKIQQAQELAQKEAQRAEEHQKRADAERGRAESERLRADEKSQFSRRLLWAAGALVILLCAAVVAGFYANTQKNEANEQRRQAEEQRQLAQAQKVEADKQREVAIQQSNIAQDERNKVVQALMEAERQRVLAEQQTAEAKKQTAEAIRQRGIAETERQKAVTAVVAERTARAQAEMAKDALLVEQEKTAAALKLALRAQAQAEMDREIAVGAKEAARRAEEEARAAIENLLVQREKTKKALEVALQEVIRSEAKASELQRVVADASALQQRYEEQIRSLQATVKDLENRYVNPDTQKDADALFRQGLDLEVKENWQAALDSYRAAVDLYVKNGNRAGQANASAKVAYVTFNTKNYTESDKAYRTALDLYQKLDNNRGAANLLDTRGALYYSQAKETNDSNAAAVALGYFREALAKYRVLQDAEEQADKLDTIGDVLRFVADYEGAIRSYKEAEEIYDDLNNEVAEAQMLFNSGFANQQKGDSLKASNNRKAAEDSYKEALAIYERVLKAREPLGDIAGQIATLNNIGDIYRNLGDSKKAAEYFQRAQNLKPRR
jgi:tetratricopeptide (TPR) repeat protein